MIKHILPHFFGGILHFCYSALNAGALNFRFPHFLSKMQVPYEYHRSQTLASKFAHSALTEWRKIKKYVILSVSEISHRTYAVLYSKGLPQSLRSFAMTVKKVRHIERQRNIPRPKWGEYMPYRLFGGILHYRSEWREIKKYSVLSVSEIRSTFCFHPKRKQR